MKIYFSVDCRSSILHLKIYLTWLNCNPSKGTFSNSNDFRNDRPKMKIKCQKTVRKILRMALVVK